MQEDIQEMLERLALVGRRGRGELLAAAERVSARVRPAAAEPEPQAPPRGWEEWVQAKPLVLEGFTWRAGFEHARSIACKSRNENGWCENEALFAGFCATREEAEQAARAVLARKGLRGWVLSEERQVVPMRLEGERMYDLRATLSVAQALWVREELYRGDGKETGCVAWDLARAEPRCEGIVLPTEPVTLFAFMGAFPDLVHEDRDDETVVRRSSVGLQNVLDFVRTTR